MQVPANLVHQRPLPSFPPSFNLAFEPQYVAPAPWGFTVQYAPAPVQSVLQQEGLSLGTFLAIGTTIVSVAVMLDPKASKEAKAIAQVALGVSMPFVLNKAFDLEARRGQQWS